MKYKHILYPTDGSEFSKKALIHVRRIAKAFDAEVTILSVYQIPFNVGTNFSSLPPDIFNRYKNDNEHNAKKIADEMLHELINLNINANSLILEGNPRKIICDYSKKLNCDLIIMGTRGHSEATNYIGSTSTYVINNTPHCPVMIVD